MQDLYQSFVKTQHSFIENVSLKDQKEAQKPEELRHILKWIHRRAAVMNDAVTPKQSGSPQCSYHMVKIQTISNLQFKKVNSTSKLYALLITKLVNAKSLKVYPKMSRIVKLLEQTSTYLYELKEPVYLYFYSHSSADLMLKMEILLLEQDTNLTTPFFASPENGGSIEIDFIKEHKPKEKKNVIFPNEFVFISREGLETNSSLSGAAVTFTAVKSEAYRYLEKIISENTLCDTTDKIAGIMGYMLPLGENALTDFALTPEAQGLQLTFAAIDISSLLIREASVKAEVLFKNKYCGLSKISAALGDILLQVKFHNGWKIVSSSEVLLKEKAEIHLKTNNSNISDINIQSNKKFTVGKTGQIATKIKNQFKHYACDSVELDLIFPNEEECVLIYQIVAEVTVKGEMITEKKEVSDMVQEKLVIPICFGLQSARAIGNFRSNSCNLSAGGCLESFQHLKQAIQQYSKQLTFLRNQNSKGFGESKNRIPSILVEVESISNHNKTLKTMENASQLPYTHIKNEIGFLDLEMRLFEKKESPQDNINMSLPLENLSALNPSKLDGKDKIQNEKERIAKQSKKNATTQQKLANRLDITFTKQVVVSEHQKNQMLSKILPPKNSIYYTKETFLALLRQQVVKHYPKPINPHFDINNKHKLSGLMGSSEEQARVLCSLNMSRMESECIAQVRASKYFYYLCSNYLIHQKYYFKYEETPVEIIKTELSEASYNNCYFINFIEISNHINNHPIKFPKVFYFKLKFFNQEEIRSEPMTVNKDTGEITLLNSTNATDKILHIEVTLDEESDNFMMKAAQFIQYLHNGVLNIHIVDYLSGLTFGTFTLPLRNLIRKRRNEVIYLHQDCIYHRNIIRGNMKVQVRGIRKMRTRIPQQPTLQQYPSPIKQEIITEHKQIKQEEADHRMDRIMRFKENKGRSQIKQSSALTSQLTHVGKIIGKAYVGERTKIAVSYLKKQFFFIEVINRHDSTVSFRINITDQDSKHIQKNPLSGQEELTIVKEPAHLDREDYDILAASKKNQQKLMKCLKVSQEEVLEMGARAKGYLLLCYLTVRRYREWEEEPVGQQLITFNRERTVTCSFANEKDGNIEFMSAIDIVPLPEEETLQLEYYRPALQQSLIHIPFIDPQFLFAKIDQILVDDPYVMVLPASNSLPLINRFTSLGSGLYLKLSNDIAAQSFKDYNILLLIDVKKKQALLAESRRNERVNSRNKQSRYLPEPEAEVTGPKMVNLMLRVWGCQQLTIQLPLWSEQHSSFTMPSHAFKKDNVEHFVLISDHEESLRFYQDRKSRAENLQILRVKEGDTATEVFFSLSAQCPNLSYISVHAIEASKALAQQESLVNKEFLYVQPFYRMVIGLQAFVPTFREMLKINVNRATQGVMEELFLYRSNCNKKTEFRVLSSDASLVWVANNDTLFQMDPKAERKITIAFHTHKIIERHALTGSCQGVVLGVKWEKGIDYFGFRFNLY